MKLIVTIPAYNEEESIAEVIKEIPRSIEGISQVEVLVLDDGSQDQTVPKAKEAGADYIISHKDNKGLAKTFQDAIDAALERGADIIVNTDADNHYNQSRIPELITPILKREADVVIGSRDVKTVEGMPFVKRYLNLIGSFITSKLAGMPPLDVSTGFRAYSREAALRLAVYSSHTYVHVTLLSAVDHKLTIKEIPIPARKVTRPSRLIQSVPSHLISAGTNILRNIILFKPLRFFGIVGGVILLVGLVFVIRFLYYYFTGDGAGHIQSIVLAGVLMIIGFQVMILGLIASAIGWSRKILEDILYFLKKDRFKK